MVVLLPSLLVSDYFLCICQWQINFVVHFQSFINEASNFEGLYYTLPIKGLLGINHLLPKGPHQECSYILGCPIISQVLI